MSIPSAESIGLRCLYNCIDENIQNYTMISLLANIWMKD